MREERLTLDCESEVDRRLPISLIVGDTLQLVGSDVCHDTHSVECSVREEVEEVGQSWRVSILLREVHRDVVPHVSLRVEKNIELVVIEPEFVVHDRVQVRQRGKSY